MSVCSIDSPTLPPLPPDEDMFRDLRLRAMDGGEWGGVGVFMVVGCGGAERPLPAMVVSKFDVKIERRPSSEKKASGFPSISRKISQFVMIEQRPLQDFFI